MAAEEQVEAVTVALAEADEASQKKLAAASERAKKDKERAIGAAVKKALAEQQEGDAHE